MTGPNLSTIKKMSQGDLEFEKRILDIARQELDEETEAFNQSMASEDYEQAAQLVHKIKHKISLLGMEKSYALAEVFEEQLQNGLSSLFPEFEDILEKMITFLKESE